MTKTFVTSLGATIRLGQELGKGGEGSVYEVPQLQNQVAKIYHSHNLPDVKKQAKLAFMASTADQQLLNYVAWPQATLQSSKGGAIVGFLMPKVVGRDPIHMVYSPAHRRQERPKAAWDFLLYVARNTAAAFDALHAHGHVLGDVNQGNVMVGGDSKVVLIDSDSFQVNARGSLHLCEVGVAHFTPPELQGLPSFQGFTRTANHDNFGLALLVFHLLFGGRHPYSGVPLRDGVGDALETDIKSFRYAYAKDAKSRGLAPPPRSIELSMVPNSMEEMFHKAFTEQGATGGRPTAKQWETALDEVRTRLKKCSASAMHVYPDHLSKCPWCALEHKGVIYFIDLGATYTTTSTGFVLTQVWAVIDAVPAPPPVAVPDIRTVGLTPAPLPANMLGVESVFGYRLLVIVIAMAAIGALPNLWFIFVLAGWVGWAVAGSAGSTEREAERTRRKMAFDIARSEFDTLVARAKKEAGPERFHDQKETLRKLKDEYLKIPTEEAKELTNLQATAQVRQKQKFLERFFIDTANIAGVGPTRKAALRSFGIETAADVTWDKVFEVRGFGESLTRAVTDWKAKCERRFVFNPAAAVSTADKNVVLARFGAKKNALAASIGRGPGELQQLRQTALTKASAFKPMLDQAAQKVAQAQCDISLL